MYKKSEKYYIKIKLRRNPMLEAYYMHEFKCLCFITKTCNSFFYFNRITR